MSEEDRNTLNHRPTSAVADSSPMYLCVRCGCIVAMSMYACLAMLWHFTPSVGIVQNKISILVCIQYYYKPYLTIHSKAIHPFIIHAYRTHTHRIGYEFLLHESNWIAAYFTPYSKYGWWLTKEMQREQNHYQVFFFFFCSCIENCLVPITTILYTVLLTFIGGV